MPCANCLHDDLLKDEKKLSGLKKKFSAQARIGGWDSYAIIRCSCAEGYSMRPIAHPDVKKYGAVEYCTVE